MSTERPSFGLNSLLPSAYMSKAEAFAKCLQDKLRVLGGGDESSEHNGEREDSPKVFGRFSEEEIADSVFLQGPLSYKRRSVPDRPQEQNAVNGKPKYFGSLVDKRGLSSDSEETDSEDGVVASVHPRVAQLQKVENQLTRLSSVTSIDSTSSWASCEEGPPEASEDEEEVIDALAIQIKGSPPLSNPRLRNFRRRGKDDKLRKEKPAAPAQDADLFFDFDVQCFSPVNVEDEEELFEGFNVAQLRLKDDELEPDDAGQSKESESKQFLKEPKIVTPPPSPANEKIEIPYNLLSAENEGNEELKTEPPSAKIVVANESDRLLAEFNYPEEKECTNQFFADEHLESEAAENDYHQYYQSAYSKDSGICSCEETASRTGDDDIDLDDTCDDHEKPQKPEPEKQGEVVGKEICEECPKDGAESQKNEEAKTEEGTTEENTEKKREVTAPVMVICDGVEIEESYLPNPRMKLRRCSSLKTWKTPPGTPGRKKIVRFADALGLDLADVRTFLDEIPKIPNSAFEDLHYELPPAPPPPTTERTLIPMFQQPGTQMDFLQRVRQNNVALESAILTDVTLLSIAGIVRVRNLSFHKTVHVRYSKDQWASFSDLQATFVPNSSDGFCDNFSFTLYGHTLDVGSTLQFAIRYDCACGQFWDNNLGANYVFQCMPRNNSPLLFPPLGSSPTDTPWTKFY